MEIFVLNNFRLLCLFHAFKTSCYNYNHFIIVIFPFYIFNDRSHVYSMNSFISNISVCLNKSDTPSYKTNGLLFSFPYSFPSFILSRITRKTSNDPRDSEIDNKADCSLDNIDNSDEEVELLNNILKALERQDEGSKPT